MRNRFHFYAKKKPFFGKRRADTVAEFAIAEKKLLRICFEMFERTMDRLLKQGKTQRKLIIGIDKKTKNITLQ